MLNAGVRKGSDQQPSQLCSVQPHCYLGAEARAMAQEHALQWSSPAQWRQDVQVYRSVHLVSYGEKMFKFTGQTPHLLLFSQFSLCVFCILVVLLAVLQHAWQWLSPA